MADCSDGIGAYMGFTVVTDAHCRLSGAAGSEVSSTQSLIRNASQGTSTSSTFIVRSFGPWTVTQDVFDAPRLEDGCGSFRRKRFGCDRDHSSWTAVIEYNGEYDLSLLVGAEGTIRRVSPDLTYWEGNGRFVEAEVLPSQAAGEESTATVTVQWQGGLDSSNNDDLVTGSV